jgi:hypothetical protein
MIKAVSFDIGHTLVRCNNPLNWKSLYEPALMKIAESYGITLSNEEIKRAISILSFYNTRENPREIEVDSETIFNEILDAWKQPHNGLDAAKRAFSASFKLMPCHMMMLKTHCVI